MKTLNLYLGIIGLTLLAVTSAFADVKIKTRMTTAGQTSESTIYIKGKRQRSEQDFGGMKTATITQCDLRRDVQLNAQAKTYFISLYDGGEASVQTAPNTIQKTKVQNQKDGIVTTTITLKDTGERKQLFGYTARHILSSIVTESSPDACSPTKSKMETDGWYIDAEFAFDCLLNKQYKPEVSTQNSGCQDRQEFKRIGNAKLGYPVYLKTTMHGEDGEDFTTIQEVLEISPATLDSALFEVPADYREVKNRTEIFTAGMMNMSDSESDDEDAEDEKPKKSIQNSKTATKSSGKMVLPNVSAGSSNVSTTIGAKKSGVVRLGVAQVKTGSIGEGMNATELASAVRNTLVESLKGANIELVQIEAKLPSQIEAEAKQKSIDFVIYTTVSHKKGGGGFGKFLSKVAPAIVNVVPGSTGSVAGNTAIYAGKEVVYTASDAAQNVKAKDELTLEINLQSAGNSVLANQFKSKAKSDGEDILTPLIEQAAQAILEMIAKK